MIEHDTLQRFVIEGTPIRGEIVRLRASYQAAVKEHDYPLQVRKLIGEALAVVALLSATIKFKGTLVVQAQGSGPVHLLVAQADNEYRLRAVARWKGSLKGVRREALLGEGQLVMTVASEEGKRYQGVVPLAGGHLAQAIEGYFQQSEQLPTQLYLASDHRHAAGLLLQSMPSETAVSSLQWEHLSHLTRTLTPKELLTLTNRTILRRLYHEEDVRIFDREPISFRCNCSQENIEVALRSISREEVTKLLEDQKTITITCEFCNKRYAFDIVDVEKLFSGGVVGEGTESKH